ncbi:hypothetical protein [Rouxiella aceris]|nr:hypothetical protein [Rouxiella aceris]
MRSPEYAQAIRDMGDSWQVTYSINHTAHEFLGDTLRPCYW